MSDARVLLNTIHLVNPPFEEPEEVDLILTLTNSIICSNGHCGLKGHQVLPKHRLSIHISLTPTSALPSLCHPQSGAWARPIGERARGCAVAASMGLDLLFLFHQGKRKKENELN